PPTCSTTSRARSASSRRLPRPRSPSRWARSRRGRLYRSITENVRLAVDREGPPVAAPIQTQRVLGIFAKWPTPGTVKTRLQPAKRVPRTAGEWAARVAAAFLADTLDRLAV